MLSLLLKQHVSDSYCCCWQHGIIIIILIIISQTAVVSDDFKYRENTDCISVEISITLYKGEITIASLNPKQSSA